MKLVEIMKPDFIFEDDRGLLCQVSHESFAQVNAVFTKKGAVRGNFHYHRQTREIFFVISGEIELSVYCGDLSEKHHFKTGDMFMIPEEVRHSFLYCEDTYLVAFYTSAVELPDGTKDILTD